MRNTTLKISSLILCGLLIYNSLGYFLVLTAKRMAIRHQKWAQLSTIAEQQLSTFIFSKNNSDPRLEILNQKEIRVDGKLYDIVRKVDDGEFIKYFCVYDHDEESLVSKTRFYNAKTQQMPYQSNARLIINLIIKTGIISENPSLFSESSVPTFSDYSHSAYSVPSIQISPPPPKNYC